MALAAALILLLMAFTFSGHGASVRRILRFIGDGTGAVIVVILGTGAVILFCVASAGVTLCL